MLRVGALFCAIAISIAVPGFAKSKHHGQVSKNVSGQFDYYVLSLAWSPAYCESHASDTAQCGTTRYGFVLHGLWPQYSKGGYPQTCTTSQALDDQARTLGASIFPSEKLVAHEWTKHGTCSGLDAKTYFESAEKARNSIKVPGRLEPGSRLVKLQAREVSRLLRDANPALTARSLAVVCAGPELSEVRICLSRDLQLQTCGADVKTACGSGPIQIPGVR